MKRSGEGVIGPASIQTSVRGLYRTRVRAEIELKTLGHRPKHIEHFSRATLLSDIADGTANLHHWYWLVDYRNGNKKILKRAFSGLEAFKKNLFLKGTGKAWSRVGA